MPAILARLAPQLGAEVVIEPEYRIVGRVCFRNGRQSYFWHNKFNLNSVSAARVAGDKGYTNFFLSQAGVRVPRGQTFFDRKYCEILPSERGVTRAVEFASELGWPVYVKPCRRSQGDGIELATNARELRAAAQRIFEQDHTLLVQEMCRGRDYRLVMLDGTVISAYERVPLTIMGDGRSTVGELLVAKQRGFEVSGRDTRINLSDIRLAAGLRRLKLTRRSVVPKGRRLRLLEVANLSCGGTSVDVTERVDAGYVKLAAWVCRVLDLRFAGVDLIAPDIARFSQNHWVLEVNSAPGLDHYAGSGSEHEALIDGLYLRVLKAIEAGTER